MQTRAQAMGSTPSNSHCAHTEVTRTAWSVVSFNKSLPLGTILCKRNCYYSFIYIQKHFWNLNLEKMCIWGGEKQVLWPEPNKSLVLGMWPFILYEGLFLSCTYTTPISLFNLSQCVTVCACSEHPFIQQ